MKLNDKDIDRAIKLLPDAVKSVLYEGKQYVAGGFLRSVVSRERIKDIDLFSRTPEDALAGAKTLNFITTSVGEYKVITTKNAYSLKNVSGHFVQFIHRWTHATPEELIKSFDFTIAKAALWYDTEKGMWDSLVDENFYSDLAARRLNFQFPERKEDAAGSLLRVLKFVKKGYHIPNDSLAGVVARVAKHAESVELNTGDPYAILAAPYGETEKEKRWTKIIHGSIASVTGES